MATMLARTPLPLDINDNVDRCGGCGGSRRLLAVRGDRFDSLRDAADNPGPWPTLRRPTVQRQGSTFGKRRRASANPPLRKQHRIRRDGLARRKVSVNIGQEFVTDGNGTLSAHAGGNPRYAALLRLVGRKCSSPVPVVAPAPQRAGRGQSLAACRQPVRRRPHPWRSGLLLALLLASTQPAPACEAHVEQLSDPAHAALRVDRSAFARCTLAEEDYRRVVGAWLASRDDAAPALSSLALGRAVDHPWIARYLLLAAARSSEWTPRLARAAAAEHNRFVARLLAAPDFLQRLDAPFAGAAYRVERVAVEKVLLGPLGGSAPAPADSRRALPYDAQLWLRLAPRQAATGGEGSSPAPGGSPRRRRRQGAVACPQGGFGA